ncbi:hypothetical protein FRB94_011907 [Tulasnella sp. JGI-2019a]|nr:hypothetical protein FRB94_011907 [Tulasnella sp. JGI-2019a]KAG8994848.1 hypothetical protein FRB93_001438 [Tulasnella sp. JGI-2019a]KAG9027707.1 hypothetical protein FRB95_007439 [Tulasnella sp. JGI-2019a]
MNWRPVLFAILPLWIGVARGQATTNVTCSGETSWMQNALGQNPCLVSAYLSGTCNNGTGTPTWFVPTLISTGPYSPPQGNDPTDGANECRCSTVTYNLLQACSVCQGGIIGPWSDWISFCNSSVVHVGFPETVPGGTIIPGWAELDPTTTGTWNATAAEEYATANPAKPTETGSATHSSSHVGPIVGGVIGGIALIALVVIGTILWLRRRSNREGKGEKIMPIPYGVGNGAPLDHGDGAQDKDTPHYRVDMGTPAPLLGMRGGVQNMKPYDPSDPSTFPISPAPTTTYTSHDPNLSGEYSQHGMSASTYGAQAYPPHQAGSPQPYGSPPRAQRHSAMGAYTGAAEV